jgi:hypothetical protein
MERRGIGRQGLFPALPGRGQPCPFLRLDPRVDVRPARQEPSARAERRKRSSSRQAKKSAPPHGGAPGVVVALAPFRGGIDTRAEEAGEESSYKGQGVRNPRRERGRGLGGGHE